MIDKESYCEFVSKQGKPLEDVYGDLWVGGLINEKNFNKSETLHSIFCDSGFVYKRSFSWLFLFDAVIKYFSFLFRKFYFVGHRTIDNNKVVFSYYGSHLSFFTSNVDCFEIVFPQKPDYKRIRNNKVVTVYSFISFIDFLVIPFVYLYNLTKLIHPKVLSNVFSYNRIYERDFLRSFVGDICIENLFYARMFKRISKQLSKINPFSFCYIYYVHEGQGWEKLLNKYMSGFIRTGIVCSAVNQNLINFYMIKEKYVPDNFAVLGNKYKEWFTKYHSNVFVYGAGRYKDLSNLKKTKCNGSTLVLLPFDTDLAINLLNFITEADIDSDNLYIRKHPYTNSSKLDSLISSKYKRDTLGLNKSLDKAEIVIAVGDTSTVFDAVAKGCLVVVVDLEQKGYVQLSCLADDDISVTVRKPLELKLFLESKIEKFKLWIKNSRSKRYNKLSEYFDFSLDEEQMTDRILNE